MILKNPTDNEVSVKILGIEYKIRANSDISIIDEVGIVWKEIHGFLQIGTESVITESEVKEKPVTKKETKK